MVWSVLAIVGGLVLLTLGAEGLVRGAARLAVLLGVPPIVVGLTIVAFGTSAPELVVSVQGVWLGKQDVAIGNAIGSNIFNLAIILGVSAMFTPVPCKPSFVRREVPIMIAAMAAVPIFAMIAWRTGYPFTETHPMTLPVWSGPVLLGLLLAYTGLRYRRSSPGDAVELEVGGSSPATARGKSADYAIQAALCLAGLAGLVVGAHFFVDGSLEVARALRVPELVISLTLVAAGTSLPELATSVVAAIRKHADISLGNVVGSNVFNSLGVLGASACVSPLPLGNLVVYRDLPVSLGFALICLPMMFTGRRVSRLEGCLLVALYAAYSALIAWTTEMTTTT